MGQHVGGQLLGGLLQDVGQGNVVEVVDPPGGVLPPAHRQREGRLDILALEIEMAQKGAAVSCAEHAVPDEARQPLGDLIVREGAQVHIDEHHGIPPVFDGAGGGNGVLDVAADGAQRQVFGVKRPNFHQDTPVKMGGHPAQSGQLLADLDVVGGGIR